MYLVNEGRVKDHLSIEGDVVKPGNNLIKTTYDISLDFQDSLLPLGFSSPRVLSMGSLSQLGRHYVQERKVNDQATELRQETIRNDLRDGERRNGVRHERRDRVTKESE